MTIRTYLELSVLSTFEDRYNYLKLGGVVGNSTFGFDRYINQLFYRSVEWKQVREFVIVRDQGCDLGIPGYEVNGSVLVHHINPMDSEDISNNLEWILDPNFLITTTQDTHNAIHYGNRSLIEKKLIERQPGDTKLW